MHIIREIDHTKNAGIDKGPGMSLRVV